MTIGTLSLPASPEIAGQELHFTHTIKSVALNAIYEEIVQRRQSAGIYTGDATPIDLKTQWTMEAYDNHGPAIGRCVEQILDKFF